MNKKKLVMRVLFYFIFSFIFFGMNSVNSQNMDITYKATFLIPYNDHDKWGWCDTLGNIVIEPEFDHAEFFYEKPLNIQKHFLARIKIDENINFYVFNKGLLIPKNLSYVESLKLFNKNSEVIIVEEENRYGLFNLEREQLLVSLPFNYEILYLQK